VVIYGKDYIVNEDLMIEERDFAMEKKTVAPKTTTSQLGFLKEIERLIEILESSHNKEAFARASIGFSKEPAGDVESGLVNPNIPDN
jgi:hypothetical protein